MFARRSFKILFQRSVADPVQIRELEDDRTLAKTGDHIKPVSKPPLLGQALPMTTTRATAARREDEEEILRIEKGETVAGTSARGTTRSDRNT